MTVFDAGGFASRPSITIVNPQDLYDPTENGYSHVVTARKFSGLAWIAGQGGEAKDGSLSPHFDQQVDQAFQNLSTALTSAGLTAERVVKLTTLPVGYDMSKHVVITRAVRRLFPDNPPAQTLVPVPRLALDGMLFEVDAIAVL